jgi:hypothetical protein
MKYIVCDSGSLISLTSSCLMDVIYYFSKKDVKFIIPPAVKEESVDYPIRRNIKRFLFSAMRINNAIKEGVLTAVEDPGISVETKKIMDLANHVLFIRGKPLKLIQAGESEMLVLAHQVGIDYLLVDERTTRMLIEAPFRLKEHLEEEFGINVMLDKKNYTKFREMFGSMNVARSSELVMLAYEYGFFNRYNDMKKDALEAALYKIKFSGCSIGFDEIRDYMG